MRSLKLRSCLLWSAGISSGLFALIALCAAGVPVHGLALGAGALAAGWSLWLTRHVTRELDSLLDSARRLLEGKPESLVEGSRFSELCEIARAVDGAGKLQGLAQLGFEEKVRQAKEAQELAEAAGSAKSRFLATMSHELRTPMTAILGYADLLLEDALEEAERREYTEVIQRNGDHLLTVLNDILDLSKLEAGQMSLEKLDVVPWELVDGVVTLFREPARRKDLACVVEYRGKVPSSIRTDPTRARQVLMNLMSNAIKFTSDGSVRVIVSMVPQPTVARPMMMVQVVDTGIGMTMEQCRRIFDPFVQADASSTRCFGGTGLGLAIGAEIVQHLGGEIRVDSELGAGTRFSFTFEVGALRDVEWVDDPLSRLGRGVARTDPRPDSVSLQGRVLVAEDSPDNRLLLRKLLERTGLQVETANDGAAAFERIAEAQDAGEPFDLVLLDIQMPRLDGYQVASRLRERCYPGPIVALTAHATAEDREACLRAGCDDYLSKPVPRAALFDLVSAHLRKQPQV